MDIRFTRHTGFYGMGSPLEILIDGQVVSTIQQNETRQLLVSDTAKSIQIKFFWLKSPRYEIINTGSLKDYEIIMNPQLIAIYVVLFGLMLCLPLAFYSLAASVVLIIAVLATISHFLNKAYLLKEHIYDPEIG